MALAAFPAEGIASFGMPSSTAMETAQDRPRALNEPVGLSPSSFTHRWSAPILAPRRLVRTRGVIPSPNETIDSGFRGGSTGAYRHMLFGPSATRSRFQTRRVNSRSYRASRGPPQSHRL